MFGAEPNVAMYDDGAHGDGAAGDDVYGASIAAAVSGPNDMVRWRVTAKDTNNVSSRWPLFPYPDNSPEYLGTIIANPSVTSALPILHWFVEDTAAADTWTGTRASLFFNGNFYDNLFCRIRGRSIAGYPKKSYKFDFNRGFHFYFSPYEDTVEEFNLNATYYRQGIPPPDPCLRDIQQRRNAFQHIFPDAGTAQRAVFQRRHLYRRAG